MRQYRQWLWPWRYSLFGLFVLALIGTGLDMVWPLAIKFVIDSVLIGKPAAPSGGTGTHAHTKVIAEAINWLGHLSRPAALNVFGIAIISVLLVKQAIDARRSYQTGVINAKMVFRLRRILFERLLRLPLASLADMKTGGIVSRLSGDIDAISGLVQMALISPGVAIIRIVLTACILVALSWRMSAVALVLVPPMAILSLLYTRRVRPWYRSIRNDRSEIDGRLTETFGGIRVVRAFRRERREQRGYALGHHTIIRKSLQAQRMELVLETSWGILLPATSLVIVWFGGWLVLHGQAQIGDIFAFQIYIAFLLQPVWSIVSSVSQTQRSLASMERVFEAIGMPEDKPDRPGAIDAPRVVRQFRFDRVAFEYRTGTPVVKDFSLEVPGGSIVALVGPSGAGKTTLTDLVARFQDPTAGSITLNGIDLRDLHLSSYRGLLAVVPQEVFLFDGTVRDNIAYGRRDAPDAAIMDAAGRANAHNFITELPDGYDTVVGERGFKLSGGQRQRLSIARAILADPQILVLDEATSNLDTESEQLIQSALAELLKSRTTFVIAHRLSTVTHADIIVAMESGRIREVGTHDQLMEQRGFYYEMVERQRSTFENETPTLLPLPPR